MEDYEIRNKIPLLLDLIPLDILCNRILGEYSTGKTISTFAIVLEGYYYDHYDTSSSSNRNNGINSDGTIICHTNHGSTNAAIIIQVLLNRYQNILTLIGTCRHKYMVHNGYNSVITDPGNDVDDDNYVTCEAEDFLEYIRCQISSKLQITNEFNDDDNETKSTNTATSTTTDTTSNLQLESLARIKERINWISQWCSIIDYFELIPIIVITNDETTSTTIKSKCTTLSPLIVWVGKVKTFLGVINEAIVTCSTTNQASQNQVLPFSTWTVSALRYWSETFENHYYELRPEPRTAFDTMQIVPYGTLSITSDNMNQTDVNDRSDRVVVDRILSHMDPIHTHWGPFNLFPEAEDYDPTIPWYWLVKGSTTMDGMNPHGTYPKFKFYWDSTVHTPPTDWDETVTTYPTYAIKIMQRLAHLNPHPYVHTFFGYKVDFNNSNK